jgi:hypothetical protein
LVSGFLVVRFFVAVFSGVVFGFRGMAYLGPGISSQ